MNVSGTLGYATVLGVIHLATTCETDSGGQTVCVGGASFFAGLGILLFVYIAIAVLGIIAAVKVVSKAGYSGWWVLISFVPLVGSVFILIFAFSTWPVTREVEMLRAQVGARAGYARSGSGGGYDYQAQGSGTMPQTARSEAAAEDAPMPSFHQFVGGEVVATHSVEEAAARPAHAGSGPPAGWFPAPDGPPGRLRYWDGAAWTDHYS
jgi:hypothetical protein